MLFRVLLVQLASLLLTVGCQKESTLKVSQIMENFDLRTEGKSDIDLLILLPSSLSEHQLTAVRQAGKLTKISGSNRLYRLQGSKKQITKLELNTHTKISLNDEIRLTPMPSLDKSLSSLVSSHDKALELLTVRNVVGVNDLVQRFPAADGRGIKVAVFDTGIDFGVSGLSDPLQGRKLEGFYDFTNFGVVRLNPVLDEFTSVPFEFSAGLEPKRILATGILSERQLARDYLVAGGLDLNGNGSSDEQYHFVLGVDINDEYAVWIDLDGNGLIADPDTEILRDFNKSHQYIDMVRRGNQKGSHALAVTIHSESKVQFHRVLNGHGTACALIIGGNGYADGSLMGLAPNVSLLSYTLDVTGQDIYTMDQFIEMFLHAKNQGVDAISISWGFSTSDLGSARFFADFLDREIVSQGIMIAIAAGNNGPGISSGPSDDYIPHHGFGVGAMISKKQAQNVYGWTGADRDAVVDYSSFGPTRGGRQIPDLISPIISLVRGVRESDSDPFHGFSGTSSATPALVGASAALLSVLKQHGPINMRLLKLALQNSGKPLKNTMSIRQGSGTYDVSKAYDIYMQLVKEWKKAQSGQLKQSSFAYELRAEIKKGAFDQTQEGLYAFSYMPSHSVSVKLTESSRDLIDPLYFYEPLLLSHEEDFFEAPAVLNLQASGANFQIKFKPEQLENKSGLFSDVISLKRASDGLVLLRIPVVLQLSKQRSVGPTLAKVSTKLKPFDIWRMPIELKHGSPIVFSAMIAAQAGFEGARINISIRAEEGHVAAYRRIYLTEAMNSIEYQSPLLPKGRYELLISRNFGRPAVLAPVDIFGSFSLPKLKLLASQVNPSAAEVEILLGAEERFRWTKARLIINGKRYSVRLQRAIKDGQNAYLGSHRFPFESEQIKIGLSQAKIARSYQSMLHMNLALLEPNEFNSLYRGWVDVQDAGSVLQTISLSKPSKDFAIIAYPNIINWDANRERQLNLEIEQEYPTDLLKHSELEVDYQVEPGQKVLLRFDAIEAHIDEYGILELEDEGGSSSISLPLRLNH